MAENTPLTSSQRERSAIEKKQDEVAVCQNLILFFLFLQKDYCLSYFSMLLSKKTNSIPASANIFSLSAPA